MADKIRVLYVDDEPDLLEIGKLFLERDGTFTVDTLASARQALEQLNTVRYDAIISDYQMPEMDGIAFLKQLKGSGNQTPFIIFTGRGREEVVIEALNNGADFYVRKGVEPASQFAELSNKIRSAVTRRYAEVTLSESETRYRHFFESFEDLYYQTDTNGLFTILSPSLNRLTGWTPEELIGKPAMMLYVNPGDKTDLLKEITKSGHVSDYELLLLKRDGTPTPVSLTAHRIFNVDGTTAGIAGIMRDITRRKQAEDELRRSRQRYRNVVEDQTEFICLFQPDGTHVFVNDAYCRYFGKVREEIIGSRFRPEIHPDDAASVRSFFSTLTPVNPVDYIEHRIIMPDGSTRWLRWSDRAIFDPAGRLIEYQSVGRDITQRKEAEISLEKSERRNAAMIAAIPDTLMIVSRNGEYLDYHTKDERYLARDPKKIIGTNIRDNGIRPDMVEKILKTIALTIDTGAPQGIVYDLAGPSHTRHFEARLVKLDESRVLAVVRDITERRMAEEALHQANKKLTVLNNITRHDILNQLTGLRTYLELSKDSVKDPVVLKYILKEEQAAEAIQEQIEFTRNYQDIGAQAPNWQVLSDVISSAVRQLKPTDIEINVAVTGVKIFADPLIGKVFYNLMENSLRHGAHITRMDFSLRQSGDELILSYRDNGMGITQEDKKNLFQKGFGKHTGLGLFLSKEILSITGIAITENGEPGKGVHFEITVPEGMWLSIEDGK